MDRKIERFSSSARPEAGADLAGEVVGYALFRMTPAEVPSLRKRPGPIPEGMGFLALPPLLRHGDEQTIAGDSGLSRRCRSWFSNT